MASFKDLILKNLSVYEGIIVTVLMTQTQKVIRGALTSRAPRYMIDYYKDQNKLRMDERQSLVMTLLKVHPYNTHETGCRSLVDSANTQQ